MTPRELAARLAAAGIEDATEESRLLFVALGGYSYAALLANPPDCRAPALLQAAERRIAREPLGYILGEAPFYRYTLRVGEGCLIPRADTERLVELALARLPQGAHFCDLCTGCGTIALSLLAERPDLTALATDLSETALAFAAENAVRLGVSERVTLLRQDLLQEGPKGRFAAILSNPPYITAAAMESLQPEVRREPPSALCGGEDGLDFYRRILDLAPLLEENGFLLLECGYDQEKAMRALCEERHFGFSPYYDYGNRFRVALVTP